MEIAMLPVSVKLEVPAIAITAVPAVSLVIRLAAEPVPEDVAFPPISIVTVPPATISPLSPVKVVKVKTPAAITTPTSSAPVQLAAVVISPVVEPATSTSSSVTSAVPNPAGKVIVIVEPSSGVPVGVVKTIVWSAAVLALSRDNVSFTPVRFAALEEYKGILKNKDINIKISVPLKNLLKVFVLFICMLIILYKFININLIKVINNFDYTTLFLKSKQIL